MIRYSFYKPNQPDSDLGYLDTDSNGDWVEYDDAMYEMRILEKQNAELLEALRKIIVSSNPNEWTELAFKAIQKAEGGNNGS